MSIRLERKRRSFAPVAMADIAFLLLVFFIVTVSIGDSPEVELPRFKYARETGFAKTFTVELRLDGQVLVDGSPATLRRVPDIILGAAQAAQATQADQNTQSGPAAGAAQAGQAAGAVLAEAGREAAGNSQDPVVQIFADASLPYEQVDELMQLLAAAGLLKVILITDEAVHEAP